MDKQDLDKKIKEADLKEEVKQSIKDKLKSLKDNKTVKK